MLSVSVICVGKLGEKFWKQACDEYIKRLQGYCKIDVIALPEQRLPDCPSETQLKAALKKEAGLIARQIPQGAAVIAMCVEGKTMSSEMLAQTISHMTVSGISKIAFLIGSSCGMDETLKQQARLRLSMSPMTFPHHLARVMVLEQIYRALNLIDGGKYHK